VLAISQCPIAGNQQKQGSFWKRIHEHYENARPGGFRPSRSLETKWGQIKHDVNKFVGVYQRTLDLQVSGTSRDDIMHMARELYRTKNVKNADFSFEHCWLLVKDFPRWAEGWVIVKTTTPSKRKAISSNRGSHEAGGECESAADGKVGAEGNQALRDRPIGTKAAKENHKADKVADSAFHKQATTSELMAEAVMRKVGALEDHNLILLMTAPDAHGVQSAIAQEFMKLRQTHELKKLHKQLAAQDQKEKYDAIALEVEEQLRLAATSARQALEDRDNEETCRQMQQQYRILQERDLNEEDNHEEEENEFQKDQLEGEDGFEGSQFGFSDADDVIEETHHNEEDFSQARTSSSKSFTCIDSKFF